eukprot:g1129.t1
MEPVLNGSDEIETSVKVFLVACTNLTKWHRSRFLRVALFQLADPWTRRSTVSLKVVKVVSACCVLQLRAIDA